MNNKFFSIIVGDRPAEVQVGYLDASGQPQNAQKAYISKAGTAVPNYSRVWGKLVRNKKEELTGEIQFLPWNHAEGEVVEIRHLPTFTSLSVLYQKEKKAVLRDENAELNFSIGVNNYDRIKDKMLIMMLEHHYQNSENESRDPSVPVAFSTYDPDKITRRKTTDIQRRQQAENIVIGANYDDKALMILAALFNGIDPRQQQDILFAELMDEAQNYAHFLDVMDFHRAELEEILEKALEINLIDCTENSILIMKNGVKEFLIQGIEPSKEGVKYSVLQVFYKPEIFDKLQTLKAALKTFTELELQ